MERRDWEQGCICDHICTNQPYGAFCYLSTPLNKDFKDDHMYICYILDLTFSSKVVDFNNAKSDAHIENSTLRHTVGLNMVTYNCALCRTRFA